MNKLDALMQSESNQSAVDAMCEAQDAALMRILALAKLARAALDSDAVDAAENASHALAAILEIASAASERLDVAQIAISDARLATAARAGAAAPFRRVEPLWAR